MAVQRSDTLPEGMIPVRISSLSTGTNQTLCQPIHTDFVTWPAPDGWYTPPRGSLHDAEEPFPDFQDPSKTLIIERTLLLDVLCARTSMLNRNNEHSVFEALLSRVAQSGHIKHDQDLSRTRPSVQEILAMGESYRAQRTRRNTVKLPLGWRMKTNYHSSSDDWEPKDILKEKMRDRCDRGVHQAMIYARNFGMRFLDGPDDEGEHERGRQLKRVHHGAFDRATVFTALTALRQTFPDRYQEPPLEQSKTHETSEKEWSEKPTTEEVSQQELASGKGASPSANDTEGYSGSSKYTHTFASGKRMTSSFFRGLACNGNVGRFSDEKNAPQGRSILHSNRAKLDKANGCSVELDSFPVVLKMNVMARRQSETSESLASGHSPSRRRHLATKEFVIEAGIVVASEVDAPRPAVERPLMEHSSIGSTDNNTTRATIARMYRPFNRPRIVQVKARNKMHKHLRPQKSSIPVLRKVKEPQEVIALNLKRTSPRQQVKVEAQHHQTLSESEDKLRGMMARLDRQVFGENDAR